jgi:bacteriochlorophyllide a dehydrogenase
MRAGPIHSESLIGSPDPLTGLAVVLEQPEKLSVRTLELVAPGEGDIVVDVEWSGISTGTEKLLWSGRMPPFPGLAYPLVPGYETVGRVAAVGVGSERQVGERVFVPGSRCFGPVAGLFGGAAQRLVVPASKTMPLAARIGEDGVLLALAATAWHVTAAPGSQQPDLIIGHGVLGRLLARIAVLAGGPPPVVWESNVDRHGGVSGYTVIAPDADTRRDYRCVVDASGDPQIIDRVVPRVVRGGELVLAGFYTERLSFAFPAAFQRELRLRIAAEFQPQDLAAVHARIAAGELSLDGLITHRRDARDAPAAYRTAFTDAACLKMVLDWRDCA